MQNSDLFLKIGMMPYFGNARKLMRFIEMMVDASSDDKEYH